MIYYFSGTGNSLLAARLLGEGLAEAYVEDIVPAVLGEKGLAATAERLVLVVPVYAWGMPKIVDRFLEKLFAARPDTPYLYVVLTHGDDVGRADDLLRDTFRKHGLALRGVFSVRMRNTYVFLPGFDTDSADVEQAKTMTARTRCAEIAARIRRGDEVSDHAEVTPGGSPWLKTYALRPLFNRLFTSPSGFFSDAERCTRCGRCTQLCPQHNIAADAERRPQWGKACTLCLRCYHGCPTHAIEYGHFSKGKRQVKLLLH